MDTTEATVKSLHDLVASALIAGEDVHGRLALLQQLNDACKVLEAEQHCPHVLVEEFRRHVAALIGFDSDFGRRRDQTAGLARQAIDAITARPAVRGGRAGSG